MAVSVIPALIDALVAAAVADDTLVAAGVNVTDSFAITEDPGHYLQIGVEDPDEDGYTATASAEQAWAHAGSLTRDEIGDITCAALAWNGDADPKQARVDVFTIVEALAAICRADPSLGVDGVAWTSFGTSFALNQAQGEYGAAAQVLFRIHFRARI